MLTLVTPSSLDEFEPMETDVPGLQEQLLRLRALFIDTQRALFAAKVDAANYERELTALRWRAVTLGQSSQVSVQPVSAALGETTEHGALLMRTPRVALDEFNVSHGAQRAAALLAHSPAYAGTTYREALSPGVTGTQRLRGASSGLMSGPSRIAEIFK